MKKCQDMGGDILKGKCKYEKY